MTDDERQEVEAIKDCIIWLAQSAQIVASRAQCYGWNEKDFIRQLLRLTPDEIETRYNALHRRMIASHRAVIVMQPHDLSKLP